MIIPVLVTIYSDRSFTFITKTPPASELLKRAAGIVKGSAEPNRTKVGKVTRKQVEEIAQDQACGLEHHQSRLRRSHRDGYGAQHGSRSGRLKGEMTMAAKSRKEHHQRAQEGRSAAYTS